MIAHDDDSRAPRVHDERREAVEGVLATIGIFSFVFLVTWAMVSLARIVYALTCALVVVQ